MQSRVLQAVGRHDDAGLLIEAPAAYAIEAVDAAHHAEHDAAIDRRPGDDGSAVLVVSLEQKPAGRWKGVVLGHVAPVIVRSSRRLRKAAWPSVASPTLATADGDTLGTFVSRGRQP